MTTEYVQTVVSSDGVTTDLHLGFILQYHELTQLVVVINLLP